jgi:hypothetical protein
MSGKIVRLGLAAAALAVAGASHAQREPALAPSATSAHIPRSPFVNVRLSPELGEAEPAVRAALIGLPVRIAEPADYELNTRRNYPQTLIATDALQEPQYWSSNFGAHDEASRSPRTFELGNLVLGDYRGGLTAMIGHLARAKALLALESAGGAAAVGVDSCMAWLDAPDGVLETGCHDRNAGLVTVADSGELPREVAVQISNRSSKPRYVALLLVEPQKNVSQVPLPGNLDRLPLGPGATVLTDVIERDKRAERFHLVTIASDQPIDVNAFLLPNLGYTLRDCASGASGCKLPASRPATAGWSVSVAEYRVDREILAGLGGGASALDGMAPWMAAIYSTVPYTPAEIAADALKPVSEREHLAERNPRELAHRCGGALIAPDLVLTAAHCVAKGNYAGRGMSRVMAERRVRIGTLRLGRGGTTYAIAGVAVPASYSPGRQDHDIALLLIKPDRDTRTVDSAAVQLGSGPLDRGARLTAFGWGYTGAVAPGSDPLISLAAELQRNPDILQFGSFMTLDWGKCRRRMSGRLGTGMLCVVAPGPGIGSTPEKNVFTCRGDSGGPLVRKVGGTEELVGVTSWSMGCGYKDYPSVYTDVTKYGRWIAAARRQLKPGLAIRVDENAAPSPQERRPQSR